MTDVLSDLALTPEYDGRSDEWCLAPGRPLTEAHIAASRQRPQLVQHWPGWLLREHEIAGAPAAPVEGGAE